VAALAFDAHTAGEHFNFLERLEKLARRWPTVGHRLVNLVGEHATAGEMGGRLSAVLADRLRISKAEANRRIKDAEVLGPRTTVTDESLKPLWPATAAAQAAGRIGAGHVKQIRRFFRRLSGWVDEPTRERAERDPAKYAADLRPDEDRARRHGITVGRQGEPG
jgi:hypothetical protein